MRYQVPQFIEHEPKVVGPFTLRQSMYIGGPLVIGFFLYFLLPTFWFVATTASLEIFGLVLNFVTIGGRPIPVVLWHSLFFFISSKTFIWKKGRGPLLLKGEQQYTDPSEQQQAQAVPTAPKSKLKSLAVLVETRK
jgi:hypothetical protein